MSKLSTPLEAGILQLARTAICISFSTLLLLLNSCYAIESINSFEECVNAGYPVQKSLPPRCTLGDGRVFVKGEPLATVPLQKSCEDLCGDGECQEIVCLALGCPCAETPDSCPKDCTQ